MKEKDPNCTTCKNPLSGVQKSIIVLSVYILLTSIYGTIELINLVSNLIR
jgi:hypothetical protein